MPLGYSNKTGLPFVPPNRKGASMSKEAKKKIGIANLGKKLSDISKKKVSDARKKRFYENGFLNSLETRKKISEAKRGKGHPHTEEYKKKMSKYWKARILREGHIWYRGGITGENMKIRKSLEYRLWREAVFKRDNYTCVWCGITGKKGVGRRVILNADHIKPFAYFPELRFAIDNGRTLCIECHRKTDSYGVNLNK